MENKAKPSPQISGFYKVVGVAPGIIVTKKHGDVDLRSISLEKAHALHKDGFRYLKKIEKPAKELPDKK